MKLKILQWNVLYSEDIKKVRKFIEQVDPDICGLQELTVNSPKFNDGIDTARYLGEELYMHHFFMPAQTYDTFDPVTLGNGILSKVKPKSTRHVFVKEPQEGEELNAETEG